MFSYLLLYHNANRAVNLSIDNTDLVVYNLYYRILKENEVISRAFLVGIHRYMFEAGKPLEIVGVKMFTPEGFVPLPCYVVQTDDGRLDYTPVKDSENYKIISEEDVRAGKIPKITQ